MFDKIIEMLEPHVDSNEVPSEVLDKAIFSLNSVKGDRDAVKKVRFMIRSLYDAMPDENPADKDDKPTVASVVSTMKEYS